MWTVSKWMEWLPEKGNFEELEKYPNIFE